MRAALIHDSLSRTALVDDRGVVDPGLRNIGRSFRGLDDIRPVDDAILVDYRIRTVRRLVDQRDVVCEAFATTCGRGQLAAVPVARSQRICTTALGNFGTRTSALRDAARVAVAQLRGRGIGTRSRIGLVDGRSVLVARLDDRCERGNCILRDRGLIGIARLGNLRIGINVRDNRLARGAGVAGSVRALTYDRGRVQIAGLADDRIREIARLIDRDVVVVADRCYVRDRVVAALDDVARIGIPGLAHAYATIRVCILKIVVRVAHSAVDAGLNDRREVGVTGLADARFVEALALRDLRNARSILVDRRILRTARLNNVGFGSTADLYDARAFIGSGLFDIAIGSIGSGLLVYQRCIVRVRLVDE